MSYEATEEVKQYIIDNHKLSDEEILGGLIPLSVPFNSAKGVLKAVLEENGLRLSKAQRDSKAADLLSDFEPNDETEVDEVNEMIENLVTELDCTANIARAYVRAIFVENEVSMPKASGGGGKKGPRAPGMKGDVKLSADFAIANPEEGEGSDLAAFKAYMDENGGSVTKNGKDKSAKWYSSVADLRIFGKKWQETHC